MSRVYAVTFENQTIAAASGDYDLFYIAPADDKPCRLLAIYLAVISELGDAQEEWLRFELIRGFTVASSGGNAVTASTVGRCSPTDPDPSFTARTADTAVATTGTGQVLHADGMNVRAGYVYIPTPEMVHMVTQAQTSLVLRMMAAVADDLTMNGTMYIDELG
jgi:hypothetical protein